MKLRIGTRKSRLAMVQTEMVKQKLEECFPDLEIEVIPMSTKGDKISPQEVFLMNTAEK